MVDWNKAQIAEAKGYRTRNKFYVWESSESWEEKMRYYFSLDFSYFTGKRVLEIGCGDYGLIHYINVPCYKVGLDPLVDKLKVQESDANLYNGIAENLPFENKSFDTVVCINVFDHIFDPVLASKEIARVLDNKGVLLLNVNVFNNIPNWVRIRLGKIDIEHPYHYTSEQVVMYFYRLGFVVSTRLLPAYEFKIGYFDKHAVKLRTAKLMGMKNACFVARKLNAES
jgi:SAM-dependent methyltransferase